jgi:hypothetical protein
MSFNEVLLLPDDEFSKIILNQPSNHGLDDRLEVLNRMMPEILKRLNRSKHATIHFVYETYYHKEEPNGYGYTQFKKYLREYRKDNDQSYHNEYKPGEEWQIDFAGDPLYIVDPITHKRTKLTALVCVMPFSNLPFMMAIPKATTEWFYEGLNRGLEFMGALPAVAKSDNMKQWVTKADRYCPAFSATNLEWCTYYGIEPTACRVRAPRDKGPCESAVHQMYMYVYARLEQEEFATIESLNGRILELLDEYCSLPYKGSSRREIFEQYEKPQMRSLPEHMYRFRFRKEVKLGSTYHICVGSERHFYSVPYKYIGKTLKVMWDLTTVEVYADNQLVCVHNRSHVPYGYNTEEAHMPESHKAYEKRRGVNAVTLIEGGNRIGASVGLFIEKLLKVTTFPQQAYGKCNGVLSLAKKYGYTRLDNACSIIINGNGHISYKSLCNMLKTNQDLALRNASNESQVPFNDNVRGAAAYANIINQAKKNSENGN